MACHEAIASLIEAYHGLNSSIIDELSALPTPLQFQRYVGRNRPFIVRRAAQYWTAVTKWDASYLRNAMADAAVNVAVTPFGNADSVLEDDNGILNFSEPHETIEPFNEFLDYVQSDASPSTAAGKRRNVKYAQTQNDNLRGEYKLLFDDVPPEIDFASEAFEQKPEAINFWLGNDRSTTALHKDNFENIYVQARGRKHFVLLPPAEAPCVNETPLPRGRYRPKEVNSDELVFNVDPEAAQVPVPLWDPDEPSRHASAFSQYSRAIRITLEEGDLMYLPAMWYHKVTQSSGDEGFACSVNYWYDMAFDGSFWALNTFVRDVAHATAKAVPHPEFPLNGTGKHSTGDD